MYNHISKQGFKETTPPSMGHKIILLLIRFVYGKKFTTRITYSKI